MKRDMTIGVYHSTANGGGWIASCDTPTQLRKQVEREGKTWLGTADDPGHARAKIRAYLARNQAALPLPPDSHPGWVALETAIERHAEVADPDGQVEHAERFDSMN